MLSRSRIAVITAFLLFLPALLPAATDPGSFSPLVKANKSSVVNISTRQVVKVRQPSPFGDPQMDQFFYRVSRQNKTIEVKAVVEKRLE